MPIMKVQRTSNRFELKTKHVMLLLFLLHYEATPVMVSKAFKSLKGKTYKKGGVERTYKLKGLSALYGLKNGDLYKLFNKLKEEKINLIAPLRTQQLKINKRNFLSTKQEDALKDKQLEFYYQTLLAELFISSKAFPVNMVSDVETGEEFLRKICMRFSRFVKDVTPHYKEEDNFIAQNLLKVYENKKELDKVCLYVYLLNLLAEIKYYLKFERRLDNFILFQMLNPRLLKSKFKKELKLEIRPQKKTELNIIVPIVEGMILLALSNEKGLIYSIDSSNILLNSLKNAKANVSELLKNR